METLIFTTATLWSELIRVQTLETLWVRPIFLLVNPSLSAGQGREIRPHPRDHALPSHRKMRSFRLKTMFCVSIEPHNYSFETPTTLLRIPY